MQNTLNYNENYSKSLKKLTGKYNDLIDNFYRVNVFPYSQKVCTEDIAKLDVIDIYTRILKELDSHYDIYKPEDLEKMLSQINSKDTELLDSFVQGMVKKFDCK